MILSIIIPVYNEKSTINLLVDKVLSVDIPGWTKEIILVDDCSNDGTADLIRKYNNLCKIVSHDKNKGKGSAIRSGLVESSGDYVVIQDADLEYDPNDFIAMAGKMVYENLDVLYGSRRLKKDNVQYSGLLYYFGGWIITLVANFLYNQKLTDEPTCYKMFKTEFIKNLNLKCTRFEFCPEVTALASLKGLKIKEVPISYNPRHKKDGKKIRWHDAFSAIWVLVKYRFEL